MTSVPKPLKFLRPHYQKLKDSYEKIADGDIQKQLADVVSVLAITTGKEGERESLKYRLLGSRVRICLQNKIENVGKCGIYGMDLLRQYFF